ncbi:MAG: hypothetical protein AAGU17_07920 [Anaerolineaceae bacterium]|jgi:hypothetical protein
MRQSRLIGFFLAILLGAAGGAVLGWRYLPAQVTTTRLQDLRADYQADYVLMVAEVYTADGSIENALMLLQKLNPDNPLRVVQEALLTGQQMQFENWEMRHLADLEAALRGQIEQAGAP